MFHSRSTSGTTTDNQGQDIIKTIIGKTLLEQLLALSMVVCYGSRMWCREEDLNFPHSHYKYRLDQIVKNIRIRCVPLTFQVIPG